MPLDLALLLLLLLLAPSLVLLRLLKRLLLILWAVVFRSSVRINFNERNFNSILLIAYCLIRALLTLYPKYNSHLWTVPLVEFEVTVLHITVWPLWVLLSMACVGSVVGLLYHLVESLRINRANGDSTTLNVAISLLAVMSVAHVGFASTFIYQSWGKEYWFPLAVVLVGLPGLSLIAQTLVQTLFIYYYQCFTDQLKKTVLPQLKWHKHVNFIFALNTLLLLAVAYYTQSTSDAPFVVRTVLSLSEVVYRIFCGISFHHLQKKLDQQYSQQEEEQAVTWNRLWLVVSRSSVRINFTKRNLNSILLIVYCLIRALLTLYPQYNSHLWTVPLVEFEVTVLHIMVWPLWVLLSMACVNSVFGLLNHLVESWRANRVLRANCDSTKLSIATFLAVMSVVHFGFTFKFIYQHWGGDYWFPLAVVLVGLLGLFVIIQTLVQTLFIYYCLCFTNQLKKTVLPQLKWHKHVNVLFVLNTLLLLAVAIYTQSTFDALFVVRTVLSLSEVVNRIFCGILFHHLQKKLGQLIQEEAVNKAINQMGNSKASELVPNTSLLSLSILFHVPQMNVKEVIPCSDETTVEESGTRNSDTEELAFLDSSIISFSDELQVNNNFQGRVEQWNI